MEKVKLEIVDDYKIQKIEFTGPLIVYEEEDPVFDQFTAPFIVYEKETDSEVNQVPIEKICGRFQFFLIIKIRNM
jgi:hypothetical protein